MVLMQFFFLRLKVAIELFQSVLSEPLCVVSGLDGTGTMQEQVLYPL